MTDSHRVGVDPTQKRRFWKEHIDRWQQSGMSQVAYCRQYELKAHQLTYWKKRLAQPDAGVAFVPLQFTRNLPVPVSRSPFHLLTPNGYKIEVAPGFDPITLKQLIAAVKTV